MDQNPQQIFKESDSDEIGLFKQPRNDKLIEQEWEPNIFFVAVMHEIENVPKIHLSRKTISQFLDVVITQKLQSNIKQLNKEDIKIEPILSTSIQKACGVMTVENAIIEQLLAFKGSLNFNDANKGITIQFDINFLPYNQISQCELINQGKFEREFWPIQPIRENTQGNQIIVAVNYKDLQIYSIKKILLKEEVTWEKLFQNEVEQIQEIFSLTRLSHPNILRLYSWWIESETKYYGQKAFYLYEQTEYNVYLKCHSLFSFRLAYQAYYKIEEKRNQIKSVVKQILSGLDYMHCKGFFHKNLKIEHILVTKDLNDELVVKISDFELSKIEKIVEYNNTEQQGQIISDAQKDLYEIGIIILDLCYTLENVQERTQLHEQAKQKSLPHSFIQAYPEETMLINALLSYQFKTIKELQKSTLYENFQKQL